MSPRRERSEPPDHWFQLERWSRGALDELAAFKGYERRLAQRLSEIELSSHEDLLFTLLPSRPRGLINFAHAIQLAGEDTRSANAENARRGECAPSRDATAPCAGKTSVGAILDHFDELALAAFDLRGGIPVLRADRVAQRIARAIDPDCLVSVDPRLKWPLDEPCDWPIVPLPAGNEVAALLGEGSIETHIHLGGALPPVYYWIPLVGFRVSLRLVRRLPTLGRGNSSGDTWATRVAQAAWLRLRMAGALQAFEGDARTPCQVEANPRWIDALQAVQVLLRERLARQGVCIEANPTSNLLVGGFGNFADLPYEALVNAKLAMSINTDDPGLFATSLPADFQRLFEALSSRMPHQDALGWLRARVADARQYTFLNEHTPIGKAAFLQTAFERGLDRVFRYRSP